MFLMIRNVLDQRSIQISEKDAPLTKLAPFLKFVIFCCFRAHIKIGGNSAYYVLQFARIYLFH